jgi:hypothetical protein
MFEFDKSKMPEVIENEPFVAPDGSVQLQYTVGNWHFNAGSPGDLNKEHAEQTIYAYAAWLQFLESNNF